MLLGLDDVIVRHDGPDAVIEPITGAGWRLRVVLGEDARRLSPQEVLDRYNDWVLERAAMRVRRGGPRPQLLWDASANSWQPCRPDLHVIVDGGAGDRPLLCVDDVELSLDELGAMLARHGAAVYVVFLPTDDP